MNLVRYLGFSSLQAAPYFICILMSAILIFKPKSRANRSANKVLLHMVDNLYDHGL